MISVGCRKVGGRCWRRPLSSESVIEWKSACLIRCRSADGKWKVESGKYRRIRRTNSFCSSCVQLKWCRPPIRASSNSICIALHGMHDTQLACNYSQLTMHSAQSRRTKKAVVRISLFSDECVHGQVGLRLAYLRRSRQCTL